MVMKKLVKISLYVGGILGALAIFNKVTESMAGELDTVLTGEERRYPWKYGDMSYTVTGKREGRPLVLLHGLEPGASAYEWRRNVEALGQDFCVYTLDLLGYGLSDHPDIEYDAEIYADLISDFLKEAVKQPAVVVAHGLTCGYAIAGAYRRLQLFDRLILVAPSPELLDEVNITPMNTVVNRIFSLPIVGEFLYNLNTSRNSIRSNYDRNGYHNPDLITDELVEYIYTSAHQSGSYLTFAALAADKLRLDIHDAFARLDVPVLAVWGREGVLIPSSVSSAFRQVNPRLDVRILDKSAYHVQEEQAHQFNALVREFAGLPVS